MQPRGGELRCIELESQQGVSQIRLQGEIPASKALLQIVAADILEPVGQQNEEGTEMYHKTECAVCNLWGLLHGEAKLWLLHRHYWK